MLLILKFFYGIEHSTVFNFLNMNLIFIFYLEKANIFHYFFIEKIKNKLKLS